METTVHEIPIGESTKDQSKLSYYMNGNHLWLICPNGHHTRIMEPYHKVEDGVLKGFKCTVSVDCGFKIDGDIRFLQEGINNDDEDKKNQSD